MARTCRRRWFPANNKSNFVSHHPDGWLIKFRLTHRQNVARYLVVSDRFWVHTVNWKMRSELVMKFSGGGLFKPNYVAKLLARMFGCVTVWKNIIMQPFCKLNLIVVELIGLDVFGVLDYNYVLITILLLLFSLQIYFPGSVCFWHIVACFVLKGEFFLINISQNH